ncbi:MAG: DUF5050 domain-containing protein [Phycisphaerae bacterium]
MKPGKLQNRFLFMAALLALVVPTAYAQTVYWTDVGTGKIQRADLVAGTGVEDLVTTQVIEPVGLALDLLAGKMYWTEASPADFMISRASLDGTDVELLVTGLVSPSGIALDVAGGKMYWTDIGIGKIQRANLDGSNVEDLLTTGVVFTPVEIALDTAGNKMYWTESTLADFMIQRADLDGSNVELLVTHLVNPSGIALDVDAGKMYWTDIGTSKIQRANLDGSVVDDLVTTAVIAPVRLALDLPGGKIYWTEASAADFMISRANLDGTNVEFLVAGLTSPSGIALVSKDTSQPIIPVAQARSVNSFVIVPHCGGDDFDNEEAEGFGPFDGEAEASIGCALAGATALAGQQSQIKASSMTAVGTSYSEASAGVPDTIHAIAGSLFDLTFELPLPGTFLVEGVIGAENAEDPAVGAFAEVRLTAPGNETIFDHTLNAGPGKSKSEEIEEAGTLDAGVYTFRAQAATVIDNDVPPSRLAEASFDLAFDVATGDIDGDANVDLSDFREFPICLTGPGGGASPPCHVFDFDFDDDVDWTDFGVFQILFTGP